MAKFRISAYTFSVEKGRWRSIPRDQRVCQLYLGNLIGDEKHYILHCTNDKLVEIRKDFALVTCFEHAGIKWFHLLITPSEFERQTSSAACFDQRVGKTETKTKSNCFFGVGLYQLGTCVGISSNYIW